MPSRSLQEVFEIPRSEFLDSRFIETNEDPMWLEEDLPNKLVMVSYMDWCLRNARHADNLVSMNTIRALAEFGRHKGDDLEHLSFYSACNDKQRDAVVEFLIWCKTELFTEDAKQIDRSIKQWGGI